MKNSTLKLYAPASCRHSLSMEMSYFNLKSDSTKKCVYISQIDDSEHDRIHKMYQKQWNCFVSSRRVAAALLGENSFSVSLCLHFEVCLWWSLSKNSSLARVEVEIEMQPSSIWESVETFLSFHFLILKIPSMCLIGSSEQFNVLSSISLHLKTITVDFQLIFRNSNDSRFEGNITHMMLTCSTQPFSKWTCVFLLWRSIYDWEDDEGAGVVCTTTEWLSVWCSDAAPRMLCSMMLCVVMMRCIAMCSTCWRCWKLKISKISLFFLHTRHRFGSGQGEKIVNISLSMKTNMLESISMFVHATAELLKFFYFSKEWKRIFYFCFQFYIFFTLLLFWQQMHSIELVVSLSCFSLGFSSHHFNTFSFQYTQQHFFLVTFHLCCCRVGDDAEKSYQVGKKESMNGNFFSIEIEKRA